MSSYAASKLKDQSLLKFDSYINGEWVKGSKTFAVIDPATGKSLGDVADHGVDETKAAINAASEAFKSFKKTTPKQRHDLLLKLFKLMNDNSDDLASLITLENGKCLTEAKGEVAYSASFLEWFAEEAVRDYGDVIAAPTPGVRNIVVKQPVGVVGLVTPWNFPSAMITRKVAPALAAGCTVVVKSPPETPFSMLAFVELAERAGVPKGVINVVNTASNTKDVGLELTTNPIVRKISFTGSTPVGRLLMKQASSTIKKCSFELGGLAPFIVFGDADIPKAVDGAIAAKFRNTGQTCVCTQFLLVHSSVYQEFADQLVKKVKAFKLGNGFDEGVTHGPIIHNAGVDKVERHVKNAVENGAKILAGGKRAVVPGNENGSWFEPTVLSDMAPCLINEEETFGPIAALYKFETEEEAISLANTAEVGLAGYFYSNDVSRIFRVAEALEVGMVGANTGLVSSTVIPFGGVKQSGLGREGSKYGLQEYTNIKLIAIGSLDA
ncbi:succinic semialdehyde dehydrogenase [Meredithblackwellia eburnea MCA 4105]